MNHPEVVDRLAILDAAHPRKLNEGLRHPSQLRRSWYFFYFQLPDLPEHHAQADDWEFLQDFLRDAQPPYTPEEMERYIEAWSQPGAATAMINYYRFAVRHSAGDIRPITAPTLVIWGEQRPLPRPHARRAPPRRRAQPRPRRAPARRLALGPPRRGRARQPAAHRLLRPRALGREQPDRGSPSPRVVAATPANPRRYTRSFLPDGIDLRTAMRRAPPDVQFLREKGDFVAANLHKRVQTRRRRRPSRSTRPPMTPGAVMTVAANDCPLRSAIQQANTVVGDDTMTLGGDDLQRGQPRWKPITSGGDDHGRLERVRRCSTAAMRSAPLPTVASSDAVSASDLTVQHSARGASCGHDFKMPVR